MKAKVFEFTGTAGDAAELCSFVVNAVLEMQRDGFDVIQASPDGRRVVILYKPKTA